MCCVKVIWNYEAHSWILSLKKKKKKKKKNQEFCGRLCIIVYGRQNEFVERVTRVFILRMRSFGQIGPLRILYLQ